MNAGWIGVDLDGTLAHYDGWVDSSHIGAPIPAMVGRVKRWLEHGVTVKIFTARFHNGPEAIAVINDWSLANLGQVLEVTATKDFRMVELWDDRAVRVRINTGEITLGLDPLGDPPS